MFNDFRFAARRLASRPWSTVLMLTTLALGIGANTAVFTVVDQTLLRPAPYADADRLVEVIGWIPNRGGGPNLTPGAILEWRSQRAIFDRFEALARETYDVTGDAEPERVDGYVVTPGLFAMLGVTLIVGPGFLEGDGRYGDAAVVISESFWRRRFGADSKIVGRTLTLSDRAHRIAGVMPRLFHLDQTGRDVLWVAVDPQDTKAGPTLRFMGMARLPAGTTLGSAQQQADAASARFQNEKPTAFGWGLRLRPRRISNVDDNARLALLVALGAVGFVLLTACANVANLFLVRATARTREMALRSALGASRGRLIREILAESLLLSMAGGAIGILAAGWAVDAVVAAAPASMAFMASPTVHIDVRVLAFTTVVSLGTGLLFGLLPALRGSRPNVEAVLRGSTEGGITTGTIRFLPAGLVVAEVALALILLVGTALMGRTFGKLNAIEPGFDPDGVVTASIALPSDRYADPAARSAFFRQLVSSLSGSPGIMSATTGPPSGSGAGVSWGIRAEGSAASDDDSIMLGQTTVGPEYFRTLRIPVLDGRTFTDSDRDAVVLSRSAAMAFWPGVSAVGRRLRQNDTAPWQTVVGVVGDVNGEILQRWNPRHMYFAFSSSPPFSVSPPAGQTSSAPARRTYAGRPVLVRATDVATAVSTIKSRVWDLDPGLPIEGVALASDVYAAAFGRQRFVLFLMGTFSTIAVTLAAAGIFSVLSQSVAQRTREIGVRIALGATQQDIVEMIVGRGIVLTIAGIAIGIGSSMALSRVLASLLFGVSRYDPASYVTVTAAFLVVAALACWLPTRRAMRIEPAVALRDE